MYFKLATRNLKKSLKDYTIYFLTLVFGVCIFYTFNSIESQKVMMDLTDMQAAAFQLIDVVMGVASVFISFVLKFFNLILDCCSLMFCWYYVIEFLECGLSLNGIWFFYMEFYFTWVFSYLFLVCVMCCLGRV